MVRSLPVEYKFLGESVSESSEALENILTIRDDRNVIYICHPNHIFKSYDESASKDVTCVDWDNIDIDMMFLYDDYGCYSIVEQVYESDNNQFNYIKKKASHMLKKYSTLGNDDYAYPFVILEEMDGDNEFTYFVRGIISCSNNGVKLAYNPQYDNSKSYQKKIEM